MTVLSDNGFQASEESLRGELIQPDDQCYDTTRKLYNGMIERRPRAIVRCADVSDVITAVNFAREHELLLAVRGGGHNGGGLGSCDDGLVIDLSRMKGVRVDPTRRTARLEGGCTWGDVDHATHAFGLATPSGIISTTGVGRLTLGGGIGYLTRKFGLAIDNLIGADMVLADGRFVTASAAEHPNLFWAIRGGGGNFGVVTSFLFQLHPVKAVVAGSTLWLLNEAMDLMGWYRDFITTASEDMNGLFAFLTVPPEPPFPEHLHLQRMCGVIWCYTGPREGSDTVFKSIRNFGSPALNGIQTMAFPVLQSAFDNLYPPDLQWYWKANFVNELSEKAISLHVEHGSRLPTMHSAMTLYPINGAAHRVGRKDTAFSHREATWAEKIVGVVGITSAPTTLLTTSRAAQANPAETGLGFRPTGRIFHKFCASNYHPKDLSKEPCARDRCTPPQVFISHSSKDNVVAEAICCQLESSDIPCWMAPRNIEYGSDWTEAIMRGITACRVFVLVFSENANGSGHVRREVAQAFSLGLQVIPFRIEDTLPQSSLSYFLETVHWLDAVTPPLEKHLNALTERVRKLLANGESATDPAENVPKAVVYPGLSVPPKPRRWMLESGLAAAVAAIGVAAWFYTAENRSKRQTDFSSAGVPAKSVAVLPFESISSSKDDGYFADGVQDEILKNLAKIAQLKVISRTSVMQYRADATRDMRQIAYALGVANVLEGTVRREGNRVRVSAQLVDARSDNAVWADSYDRDLNGIFAIQSEVAQTIAGKLSAALSPEEKQRIEKTD
jgi:TolB-like protein